MAQAMEIEDIQRSSFSTRFLGAHDNKIDGKGRLSIPAQFRSALQNGQKDALLYCFPAFNRQVIECGGPDLLNILMKSIANHDVLDEAREALEVAVLSRIQTLAFDETGRISLPKTLRDYAGLTAAAAVVGIGARFQIMTPDKHQHVLSLADAAAAANPDIMRGRSLPSFSGWGGHND
ncbi:division/cell wall cluster transcriptional repressor MraZ [Parvularcula sp. IMCC14364]|uniref:division/cell wall cluster transcriptional repressor MraZ n=1 Tax=Parvularcula sp. IMCC14364 TaxID=3067902 RepID=UPI0027420567|nr:hypothetical protein [Parvularcula sp. IMCC14364]